MRKWLIVGVIYLLVPWLTSLLWMRAAGAEMDETAVQQGQVVEEAEKTTSFGTTVTHMSRRILVERQNLQTYMTLEDYLPGVLVCQMNPDYQLEALKCQAVIARTYICRLMEGRSEIHEEELDLDYLGELDTGIFQNPKKREQVIANLERCQQAVRETKGLTMQYDGRYILPLFHRMSAGRTRKGEADFPYLQAAESSWDTKRESYLTEADWSLKDFATAVNGISEAGQISAEQVAGQIQVVKKDDSGYVEQIKIGARTYPGEEVQGALGLPSSCYTMEVAEPNIRVISRGSGHGYGLSQAGADSMAADGWRCEDILQYYYKNISLISE